jgi:ribonuclease toxin BrnT of type II toxin-antitoxin system
MVSRELLSKSHVSAGGRLLELIYVLSTYNIRIWVRRSIPIKDRANIAKHGLSLVEGEGVLNDPLGLTIEEESSEGEPRWITIGEHRR